MKTKNTNNFSQRHKNEAKRGMQNGSLLKGRP